MTLTDADLGLIRDEVGTAPDTATLQDYYTELGSGSWIPTALRVLRRRRAQLAAGGSSVSQVTIPGAIGIGLTPGSLSSLDRQISRLERDLAAWTDEQAGPCDPAAASSGRVHRQTWRSG